MPSCQDSLKEMLKEMLTAGDLIAGSMQTAFQLHLITRYFRTDRP